MKENPHDKKIQYNLKPHKFTLNGFLGKDKRYFSEIIEVDRAKINKLGITNKQLADRMQYFTDAAFENFDRFLLLEDNFEVSYDSFRGKLLCPFMHKGIYRKGLITLKNRKKNLSVSWTPLNIHMIRDHCFFEGIGSEHRLDPEFLLEILF